MATATKHIPGTTGYAHIVKRPGYCGGKAAIDKVRIRVNNIASLRKQGKTPEQMLEAYPPAPEPRTGGRRARPLLRAHRRDRGRAAG